MVHLLAALLLGGTAAHAGDWPSWRGPTQAGVADVDLPDRIARDDATLLWTHELASRGTPVLDGDQLYVFGYRGAGEALHEVLVALDAKTGAVRWERAWRDHLSDIIYDRYSIGAPTVDPVTGDVFVQGSAGDLMAFGRDGAHRWTVPMMEAYGRLTFPNGRTGAPIVVGDLVILHSITSFWGRDGPARDRFFAFDKATGAPVWSSTPGVGPKDSSWTTPLVVERGGRTVLYAGTGCGQVVAVDAATGEALWRFPMAVGGVNVSAVLDGDVLVVAHAMENLDSTETGRMVGIDLNGTPVVPPEGGTPVLTAERWRLPVQGFSSSPVLVDGVVYLVTPTGSLVAVDARLGTKLWELSLATDQLHASPLYADGRLWVPVREGKLVVVTAGRTQGRIVQTVELGGNALGAPIAADGRLYVASTERVYAFGDGAVPIAPATRVPAAPRSAGPAVSARVRPAELLLQPGASVALTADLLDARGQVVGTAPATAATAFVPPTAKVKAELDARFADGALVAAPGAVQSAGAFKVGAGGLVGETKGRLVAGIPYTETFDGFALSETREDGAFAYPPLPWIGARFKWEVRDLKGRQVLAKTLDNMIFQRSTVFFGHPDAAGYTLSASVASDGDRRNLGNIGVVNQRYLIQLKGNQRVLEISSNQERLKRSVPFAIVPGLWYRLKTEVRVAPDGTALVRAKAWLESEAEPAAWTIAVEHADGHTHGAPGLFGFTPGNLHKVYIDDVVVEATGPLREAQ